MREHEYWQSTATAEVFAVRLDDGMVSGVCGPLARSETEPSFLPAFDYDAERAPWYEQHREEFALATFLPVPGGPAPREALERFTVAAAMHPGVITCLAQTPLRHVARMMATAHIHAVVVWGDEEDDSQGIWGIISDLDVVAAAARGDLRAGSALGSAQTPVVTIREDASLAQAAQSMNQHGVSHLVVLAVARERPVGVISTLDLARVIGEQGVLT